LSDDRIIKQLKGHLRDCNIRFETSDCSVRNELNNIITMVHFEVYCDYESVININEFLDTIYYEIRIMEEMEV
jgi:hypothetical protein